jgi:hypothetical protein
MQQPWPTCVDWYAHALNLLCVLCCNISSVPSCCNTIQTAVAAAGAAHDLGHALKLLCVFGYNINSFTPVKQCNLLLLLLLLLQALLTILDSPLNKAGKIKVGSSRHAQRQ